MRLATSGQIKKIEELTFKNSHITPEALMESAGALAAKEIQTVFLPELNQGMVSVVCGPGNNGGDGLVVARHLHSNGFANIKVFKPGSFENLNELERSDLIIDALFGVGLNRPIESPYKEIIEKINSSKAKAVSLDIPSGLSADTGKVLGCAVKAHMTLTFGLGKPGLYIQEGSEHSGKIRVIPIGLPKDIVKQIATTHFLFDEKEATKLLPQRNERSNKSDHGHLLVMAGHPGMWGAAKLCTEAAYRMGAGYVTLAVAEKDEATKSFIKDVGSEVLIIHLNDEKILHKKKAVLIGPGAGVSESLKKFIQFLIKESFKNVILDADALTVLAEMGDIKLPSQWVLTPHTGELSRLLKTDTEEIENERLKYSQKASKKYGCHVLLKGHRTLITDHEDRVGIIPSGNAALAKAGTGDVLSGFIGSLLAQGLTSLQAAGTAAYIHGLLADEWLRTGHDIQTLMPRDLISNLDDVLRQFSRG